MYELEVDLALGLVASLEHSSKISTSSPVVVSRKVVGSRTFRADAVW